MATNPTDRFAQLFSGIELGCYNQRIGGTTGTLGCFIYTDGKNTASINIPSGIYLLSCYHVLVNGDFAECLIYQPSTYFSGGTVVENDLIGCTIYGIKNDSNDCAIVRLNAKRTYCNEVPAAPWHYGRNKIVNIDNGKVGDKVYKFGVFSKYTTGTITKLTDNQYTIHSDKGWGGGGDSGSLLIRESDNTVLGLNYAVDKDYISGTGIAITGYAYSIESQMQNFTDTTVRLCDRTIKALAESPES